jgi:hypothetical protein
MNDVCCCFFNEICIGGHCSNLAYIFVFSAFKFGAWVSAVCVSKALYQRLLETGSETLEATTVRAFLPSSGEGVVP